MSDQNIEDDPTAFQYRSKSTVFQIKKQSTQQKQKSRSQESQDAKLSSKDDILVDEFNFDDTTAEKELDDDLLSGSDNETNESGSTAT